MARIAFIDVTATVSYGGLQTAVWRLAQACARLGHQVTVYGGTGTVAAPADCQDLVVRTFPFTPREKVPNFGSRFQRIIERYTFARRARGAVTAGQYDWLVLDKPFDFFWPKLLPTGSRTRCAFTSGGTDFFLGDRRLARRIDVMLACSHFNAWQIRSHYKRPVEVMYYGVDTTRFAPHVADPNLRLRLGVQPEEILFAFAGRLVGWKGIAVAVRALADKALAGAPAKLLVIGDGPEREPLEGLAQDLGVSNRIIFHGPVRHDELPQYYAAADAGVFPSIGDEAFGITIAEAMACGKAVIGSYVGGIPEVVGNEQSCGLLVAPDDAPGLAQAMRHLAEDAALRMRLGAAARSRVENRFTWELAAQRLLTAMGC